jgi:hypothetical protein
MHAQSPDYDIRYDEADNTVYFKGSLRLNAAPEYAPISNILDKVLQRNADGQVIWDLRDLVFLNSSGINMLYQFVVKIRRAGNVQMQVIGSNAVPWQQKSLGNMTRFMPNLKLDLR